MNRFHLSNEAVYQLQQLGVKTHFLGQSWEDHDLNALERGEATFDLLDAQTPGKFVLIDTGDYLIPNCTHEKCETYDANYALVAIASADWEIHRTAVLGFDYAWRTIRRQCKKHRTFPTLAIYPIRDCWYCGSPEINGQDEHGRNACAAHEAVDEDAMDRELCTLVLPVTTKYHVL